MSVSQTAYYAIIPANVRYCKGLTDGAKLLYGEITALCNEKGFCWATNCYFADLYGKSADTISRWIGELVENEFITSDLDRAGGNLRKIWIKQPGGIGKNTDRVSAKIQIGYRQKSVDPIGKNAVSYKENTTLNNTSNITENSAAENSPLLPPFQRITEIETEEGFILKADPALTPSPGGGAAGATRVRLYDPELPGVTIVDDVPPQPKTKAKKKPGSLTDEMIQSVQTVLDEINTLKGGRPFRINEGNNATEIAARLKDGATLDELLLVARDKWREWGSDQKMRGYFDPVTPFRKSNFFRYLTTASDNQEKPAPKPQPAQPAQTSSLPPTIRRL